MNWWTLPAPLFHERKKLCFVVDECGKVEIFGNDNNKSKFDSGGN
jgi:hypothetical protein